MDNILEEDKNFKIILLSIVSEFFFMSYDNGSLKRSVQYFIFLMIKKFIKREII